MPPVLIGRTSMEDDPIDVALARRYYSETSEQRETRLAEEELAVQRNKEIEAELELERRKRSSDSAHPEFSVLLLGQSESGKSTTLKHFQMLHNPNCFDEERGIWRHVIYINLIRNVRRILTIIARQNDEAASQPGTIYTDPGPSSFQKLKLEISPLLVVEREIVKEMGFPREGTRLEKEVPRGMPSADKMLPETEYYMRPTTDWRANIVAERQADIRMEHAFFPDDQKDPGHIINVLSPVISKFWSEPHVKRCLKQENVKLEEESGFFLNDSDRITAEEYVPTDDDILRARLKTMGVAQYVFPPTDHHRDLPHDATIRLYDVGGGRGQRAAWAPYFDTADIIMFHVPVSAFDQFLDESPNQNRLEDSFELFKRLLRDENLRNVSICLFLNKLDLLHFKLKSGVQFKAFMSDYTGPNEMKPVAARPYFLDEPLRMT